MSFSTILFLASLFGLLVLVGVLATLIFRRRTLDLRGLTSPLPGEEWEKQAELYGMTLRLTAPSAWVPGRPMLSTEFTWTGAYEGARNRLRLAFRFRELSLQRAVESGIPRDELPRVFTCDHCPVSESCSKAFDLRNVNAVCIEPKAEDFGPHIG